MKKIIMLMVMLGMTGWAWGAGATVSFGDNVDLSVSEARAATDTTVPMETPKVYWDLAK